MSDDSRVQVDMGALASRWVFAAMGLLLFLSSLLVAGPWAGFHGGLWLVVSLLMLVFPPPVALPRTWWILAALFLLFSSAAFLPADLFGGFPAWRKHLEEIGLATGSRVVIQTRHAAESLAALAVMLLGGLWMAGHRVTSSQLRKLALAFTVGVATYAVLARLFQTFGSGTEGTGYRLFGFFPNRNHTGTYLAMGAVCGLGNIQQALRDRRFVRLGIALCATLLCVWAAAAWSISRGGVIMIGVGFLIWISIIGPRYLGKNGLRALALILLAVVGGFLIADSRVKERISSTVEKVQSARSEGAAAEEGAAPKAELEDIDFRVPIALDTFDLIHDHPLTGIGAGQFLFIFPQYRVRTAAVNDADAYHPESDWLWIASECGIPAAIVLLLLVAMAFGTSVLAIRGGRDRSLRAACLAAAAVVALHGFFDVPGHRVTLAWSAALLFALSLGSISDPFAARPTLRFTRWSFRACALPLALIALFLIAVEGGSAPPPATLVAARALADAKAFYAQEEALRKAAAEDPAVVYPPPDEADPLLKAAAVLEKARKESPLDRDLLRYSAFIGIHLDNDGSFSRHAFRIERDLAPTRVMAPVEQAAAWQYADPQESAKLWEEALHRARDMQLRHPGNRWSEAATRSQIKRTIHKNPALVDLWKQGFEPNPKP